jgi:Uma2 family endonuclease
VSTTDRAKQRRPHRFTIEQYERLGEVGILSKADGVVLLDGLVVKKMTEGPRHVMAKHRVFKALEAVLPAGWHARMESPVQLPRPRRRPSEPEPDVAVVRGSLDDYANRHPGPADTALVIEVADNSLEEDRRALARYAYHRIPCVWIVNLRSDTVELYAGPSGPCHKPGYDRSDEKSGDGVGILTVVLPPREAEGTPEAAGPIFVGDLFS